jgi:hypothetical protein
VRFGSTLIVLAILASTASAHQSSIKYVELTIDGARVDVAFKVAPGDVAEPMGLAADAKPKPAAAAAAPGVPAYVERWLAIGTGELACTAGPATARADEDGFVIVAWSATCPHVIDRVTLDLGAFFAVDRRMEAIVRLSAGGSEVTPVVVRAGDSPITLRLGESSLSGWLRAGLHHVFGGADHVSFVLVLLLVVVLEREAASWRVKQIAPSLRATAGVITAFTLAHSLTLIACALGWIALPMRLVGSLIAATIVYTAAEDIVRPPAGHAAWRWRFGLAFAFGLAHGLGFAATLAVELPPDHILGPLACFNLGVELAQLAIVAIALPTFYVVATLIGAERYRRVAMPAFSSVIFVIGTVWLIARAFDM